MPRKTPQFAIGDRVAMAVTFLRSIHDFSRASFTQRGHVTHVLPAENDIALVQVQWADGHVSKALNVNLRHAPTKLSPFIDREWREVE